MKKSRSSLNSHKARIGGGGYGKHLLGGREKESSLVCTRGTLGRIALEIGKTCDRLLKGWGKSFKKMGTKHLEKKSFPTKPKQVYHAERL